MCLKWDFGGIVRFYRILLVPDYPPPSPHSRWDKMTVCMHEAKLRARNKVILSKKGKGRGGGEGAIISITSYSPSKVPFETHIIFCNTLIVFTSAHPILIHNICLSKTILLNNLNVLFLDHNKQIQT